MAYNLNRSWLKIIEIEKKRTEIFNFDFYFIWPSLDPDGVSLAADSFAASAASFSCPTVSVKSDLILFFMNLAYATRAVGVTADRFGLYSAS